MFVKLDTYTLNVSLSVELDLENLVKKFGLNVHTHDNKLYSDMDVERKNPLIGSRDLCIDDLKVLQKNKDELKLALSKAEGYTDKYYLKSIGEGVYFSEPTEFIYEDCKCNVCGIEGPGQHKSDCSIPSVSQLHINLNGIIKLLRNTTHSRSANFIEDNGLKEFVEYATSVNWSFEKLQKKYKELGASFKDKFDKTYKSGSLICNYRFPSGKGIYIRISSDKITMLAIPWEIENFDAQLISKISEIIGSRLKIKKKHISVLCGSINFTDYSNIIVDMDIIINYVNSLDVIINGIKYTKDYSKISGKRILKLESLDSIFVYTILYFKSNAQVTISYNKMQNLYEDRDDRLLFKNHMEYIYNFFKEVIKELQKNSNIYIESIPNITNFSAYKNVPSAKALVILANGEIKNVDKRVDIMNTDSMFWDRTGILKSLDRDRNLNIEIDGAIESIHENMIRINDKKTSSSQVCKSHRELRPYSFKGTCSNPLTQYVNPAGKQSSMDGRYYPCCSDIKGIDKKFINKFILNGHTISEKSLNNISDIGHEDYNSTLDSNMQIDKFSGIFIERSNKIVVRNEDSTWETVEIIKENSKIFLDQKLITYEVKNDYGKTYVVTAYDFHPIYKEYRNFDGIIKIFPRVEDQKNFLTDIAISLLLVKPRSIFKEISKKDLDEGILSYIYSRYNSTKLINLSSRNVGILVEDVYTACIIPKGSLYCVICKNGPDTYMVDIYGRITSMVVSGNFKEIVGYLYKNIFYIIYVDDNILIRTRVTFKISGSEIIFKVGYIQGNLIQKLGNIFGPIVNDKWGYIKNIRKEDGEFNTDEIVFFNNKKIIYKWSEFSYRSIILRIHDRKHKTYEFKEFNDEFKEFKKIFEKNIEVIGDNGNVGEYLKFSLNVNSSYILDEDVPILNAEVVKLDNINILMGSRETSELISSQLYHIDKNIFKNFTSWDIKYIDKALIYDEKTLMFVYK